CAKALLSPKAHPKKFLHQSWYMSFTKCAATLSTTQLTAPLCSLTFVANLLHTPLGARCGLFPPSPLAPPSHHQCFYKHAEFHQSPPHRGGFPHGQYPLGALLSSPVF